MGNRGTLLLRELRLGFSDSPEKRLGTVQRSCTPSPVDGCSSERAARQRNSSAVRCRLGLFNTCPQLGGIHFIGVSRNANVEQTQMIADIR